MIGVLQLGLRNIDTWRTIFRQFKSKQRVKKDKNLLLAQSMIFPDFQSPESVQTGELLTQIVKTLSVVIEKCRKDPPTKIKETNSIEKTTHPE